MDEIKEVHLKQNPEAKASIISKIFLWFVFPILRLGYKRPLEPQDLPRVLDKDESRLLTEALEREWYKELAQSQKKSQQPRLHNAMAALFRKRYLMLVFLIIGAEIATVCQPIFMGYLIQYFRACSDMSSGTAFMQAGLFSFCALLNIVLQQAYFYGTIALGMQMAVACSGIIYKKVLRMSNCGANDTEVGQIVNLLANDVANFEHIAVCVNYFFMAPVVLIAFLVVSWHFMGPSCIAGYACLILLVFIQAVIGNSVGKYRNQIASQTDKRIGIMNELLTGIRVIKMYTWEHPFSEMVDEYRRKEIDKIRVQGTLHGMLNGIAYSTGKITILCAILVFVLTGNNITVEVAFVMATLFDKARYTMAVMLPYAFHASAIYRTIMKRTQKLLMIDESEIATKKLENDQYDKTKIKNDHFYNDYDDNEENVVEMINYSCKWSLDDKVNILDNINLRIKKGDLVIIVGPVGSGKSTILQALFGETKTTSGKISVNGKLAYAPQQPWIFSASVRQNVIFGRQDFEPSIYEKTIEVCAMGKDIASLPYGDGTVVGDRGVSLSGGQRARIGLARAVYCDADIYLMDDPISAVDAAVGRHIFEKCILQHLGQSARILITHQLQYLKYADLIVVMKDGEIAATGSYEHLLNLGDKFTSILNETQESYRKRNDSTQSTEADDMLTHGFEPDDTDEIREPENVVFIERQKSISNDQSHLPISSVLKTHDEVKEQVLSQIKEEDSSGKVEWSTYLTYYRYMGNVCTLFLMALLFVFVQALYNYSDIWLNDWVTREEVEKIYETESGGGNKSVPFSTCILQLEHARNSTSYFELSTFEHLYIYTGMIVLLVIFGIIRSASFRIMMTSSSFVLHSQMFNAILRAPVLFFDRNPVGRVLNRFSKDTGTMDDQLAFSKSQVIEGIFTFAANVLVVGILNPWIFLAILPLLVIITYIRYYYMQSGCRIKDLESSAKSAVFTHVSATINGLSSIRSFHAENYVMTDFHRHQNYHTPIFKTYLLSAIFFSMVIDLISAIFIVCVSFISVLSAADQTAGNVGMSLFYAAGLLGGFKWVVHTSTEMEAYMVSVKRIIEYSKLEPEDGSKAGRVPPNYWPQHGQIEFKNINLKYSDELRYSLKDLNFTIKPSEKIGIVGRTGAGKSSLLNALFRLSKLEGQIFIDNVDTKSISLNDLRKRISIIPQDPVIFIGSLRKNLDPFNEYTDDCIWEALDQVELKQTFHANGEGLESMLQEGGSNLSVGQRQLVCLARALIRRNKILVIDEATANVDLHTDQLIQKTIRQQFKHCTVLTIAHRLNTIIDSSKVMVMDGGRLVEMDHAANLLANENSSFFKLVAETGSQNADLLKTLAENSLKESKIS